MKYFYNCFESGIKQMQYLFENPREMVVTQTGQFYVDCPKTTLVHRYDQGSQIHIFGHLRVMFSKVGKIESFDFFGMKHDELYSKYFLFGTNLLNFSTFQSSFHKNKVETAFSSFRRTSLFAFDAYQ